jgi:mannose-6-phosphate isomerase-like protein (cupin superfamily)
MIRNTWALGALLVISLAQTAGGQQAPAAAPAPASVAPVPAPPALYMSAAQIADQLKAAIAKPSDPAVSPITVTAQYSISKAHRGKAGPPAIHPQHNELHFILSGSATLVTGGVIVKLPGDAGSVVEGGTAREVKQGDAIFIPLNTPHWYQKVDGEMSYLEVRFLAPADAASAAVH